MAFPAASARTKDWSTEILTDSDLETQFDILHTYMNDMLDGTTGHAHTGSDGDGSKITLTTGVTGTLPATNGGTGVASYTIGDILYASATTGLSVLNAGSAGQAVTSTGAGAAPDYAGMTTSGDVEYHDGITRQRLAVGTNNDMMVLASGLPTWHGIIGDPVNKTDNTAYQADTAGFFIGVVTAGTATCVGKIVGYSDSAASPSTVLGAAIAIVATGAISQTSIANVASFCIPVKKGNYYKGVLTSSSSGTAATAAYYFIPIGA